MSETKLEEFANKVKNHKKLNPRKNYPKTYKKEVQGFLRLGFSMSKISEVTGIHIGSIRKWGNLDKSPDFIPTVIVEEEKPHPLTIITGIDPNDLKTIFQSLR